MEAKVLYSVRFNQPFASEDERIDKAEVALIAVIGQRLKWARQELLKVNISTAAGLLDVEPSYLNTVELGFNITEIPLKFIKKAAEVYLISTDYLFGLSEDWESEPEVLADRDISLFLLENRARMFSRWVGRQTRQERMLADLGSTVDSLRTALAEIFEALDRFQELNSGYDDMPAGATLKHRIGKANQAAITAQMVLIRCKISPWPKSLPEV